MFDRPGKDKRYIDDAFIHLRVIGDDPLAPPVEDWIVDIDPTGKVDLALLRNAVSETFSPFEFELTDRYRTVGGAGAAYYDLVITITSGAGGTVVGECLWSYLKQIRQRSRAIAIKEEDAVDTARARVCRRYNVNFGDLSVVAIDNNFEHNRVTVTLTDPGDNRYVVEVYRYNKRVTVSRINYQPGGSA